MECSTEGCKNVDFENIFIKIICNSLQESFREYKKNNFNINEFLIISKLEKMDLDFNYENLLLIEDIELVIDKVYFPSSYKISKKVEDIIKNIYSVKWNFCIITFDINEYIERSEFNECYFTKNIFLQKNVPNINVKPYYENFIFFECTFEKDVTIGWETIGRLEIYKGLFLDCVFISDLKLLNTSFKFPFFSNSELYSNTEYDNLCVYPIRYIKKIIIKNCIFDSNFTINGIDLEKSTDKMSIKHNSPNLKNSVFIEDLCIKNSKFNKKFELKYSLVRNIDFDNSNVNGIFDVYKSSFTKAKFRKSIFKDFAAFEYVVFGDGEKENITDFIYTTFKDFSNFRNTKFKSGLNFSSANIKQEPNFLNTDINLVGTDRETLRIIKNSFEKNNNKIEANRFFTYEMREYRKETKWIKNPFRRFVLNANYIISGFGNNYVWPILILFASVALYVHLLIHQNEWVVQTLNLVNVIGGDRAVSWFDTVTYYANEGSKVIIPFNKLLEAKQGFEFISLLFFIWFGVLTWQIIVAVKRNTQH